MISAEIIADSVLNPPPLKLLILGHARHGKDTVCELLRDRYGLRFVSSSYFVAERAVRPVLAQQGIIYPTLEACYADRVNHRDKWFNAISEYNALDPAKLGRELFAEHDMYCGLRSLREFVALHREHAFDVCFWVDSSDRLARAYISNSPWEVAYHSAVAQVGEPRSSCSVTPNLADFVIDNNGSLEDLALQVDWAYAQAQRWATYSRNCGSGQGKGPVPLDMAPRGP